MFAAIPWWVVLRYGGRDRGDALMAMLPIALVLTGFWVVQACATYRLERGQLSLTIRGFVVKRYDLAEVRVASYQPSFRRFAKLRLGSLPPRSWRSRSYRERWGSISDDPALELWYSELIGRRSATAWAAALGVELVQPLSEPTDASEV